ncbi:MAG: cation:proton antiporter [Candidatus Heimdallarchaeota archaeon]|nr:cation:proton antiporter [Candidatus Heimdallarchaeota archaeon]
MVSVFLEQPVFLLGIFLLSGYSISLFLEKFDIPHVVSYILTGFLITNTLLRDINVSEELEDWIVLFENLALGFIGYKIGTELIIKYLRKESRLLTMLLIGEAGGAFLVVFGIIYVFSTNLLLALLLGGLATATAPAATIEMIRKLRSRGSLTTRIQWLLAFDDVLAVILVEGILVYLAVSLGGSVTLTNYFIKLAREIGLAVVIGIITGFIVNGFLEYVSLTNVQATQITLAFVMLDIGIAMFLHTSVILSTMTIGVVVANLEGNEHKKSEHLMEFLISPAIMIFFILIGVQVRFSDFSPFPILALVYLIARTMGVIVGTYLGASAGNVENKIKNNLGFGLLAQGGVALGLASLANEILSDAGEIELGRLVITIITISTIFSELLGSYGIKFALTRAGEVNKENAADLQFTSERGGIT